MAPPFDLLGSASFLVRDRRRTVDALEQALGMPAPNPRWHLDERGFGMTVSFVRVQRHVASAPTAIELVEVDEIAPGADPVRVQPQMAGVAASQGDRPVKVHATDVASARLDEAIAMLERDGRRHWIHRSATGDRRVWLGIDPADPRGYRPDDDAGLHLELLPTSVLRLPAATLTQGLTPPEGLGPGDMVRVAWRTFLVADVEAVVTEMAAAFGWEPEAGIEEGHAGARRALLGFALPQSTRLELLQPAATGEDAEALRRWGPGAWSMTVAVEGLAAKAEDLRRRGTPFREVATGFAHPAHVLRVDPDVIPDCRFDLAELADTLPTRTARTA